MAVYKRGKVYWYDFRFNGERYYDSCKTKNRIAAVQIEAKIKTDLAMGRHGMIPMKAAPTLKAFAETFRVHVRTNAAALGTVSFYESKLRRLLEYPPLADARLNEIDEGVIDLYKTHRRQTVGPKSVNLELVTLRKLLRFAWKIKKVISGTPRTVKLPGEGARTFVLTQDQETLYLALAYDTLRDFATLALDTGVRHTEGLRLEWEHISMEPIGNSRMGAIWIVKGKTPNARRVLSITPRVKAMLENRRKFYPEERFVFPGKKPGCHLTLSTMDRHHAKARAAAKLEDGSPMFTDEFVIHSLRHTFGTRLGETGASAFTIMEIMGHANVSQSQKYVHPTPDSKERAFEQLHAMNCFLSGRVESLPTKSTTIQKGSKK